MAKVEIVRNAFVYPMPMTIVGSVVEGNPNFMAVGWVSRVNYAPPMIAVAINKRHHTNAGIRENGEFSVNVPGSDMMAVTDYTGLVTGRKHSKAGLFSICYGALKAAPMIEECPLCMECKLVQAVDLPSNTLFVGEIVGAYAEEEVLTNGKPDIQRIDPFTLSMPDNRYWKVGEYVGRAWNAGKSYEGRGV